MAITSEREKLGLPYHHIQKLAQMDPQPTHTPKLIKLLGKKQDKSFTALDVALSYTKGTDSKKTYRQNGLENF